MYDSISQVLDGERDWSLVCGEALSVLQELPDECIDAIITDPPYSSGGRTAQERKASTSKKYQRSGYVDRYPEFVGDNRDQRSFLTWCSLWMGECLRVAKPGAPICVFTDWRQLPTTTDAIQLGGWIWRGILPWDKTRSARPCMGRFANQAEYVVWGSKGRMPRERGVGVLWGVVTKSVPRTKKLHIAGKPIEVMSHLVDICEPGGLVLDPFSGSASTGVACLQKGYRYIGVEMLGVFDEIGRERLGGTAMCGNQG